jgi:hypothetical protein
VSTEEKLSLCQRAIDHVLVRIQENEKTRYYLGAGTESFARLTEAYAALHDEPVDDVRNQVIPGSAGLHQLRQSR